MSKELLLSILYRYYTIQEIEIIKQKKPELKEILEK